MIFQSVILHVFVITFVLLLYPTSKSFADESVPNSDETAVQKEKQQVPEKVEESKPDEAEPQSKEEDKGAEIKADKCEPQVETDESKSQNTGSETNNGLKVADPKSPVENVDESNSQTDAQSEKNDNVAIKKEEQSPENADSKKQSSKDENNQHKTDLNDVNFLRDGDDHAGPRYEKRDTNMRESMTDYLGLPRDASYFFDDLEPFINNNSDNRVGRSAPNKGEVKGQKSKLSKGRDVIEADDTDEEDEELRDDEEEDERQNEDEYEDDDEDMDSDCKPTTPACTTKPACTTPSTCPPPTTTKKCTTQFQCPTKCPTTPPCPTKCPPKCVKPNRRFMGQSLTTDKPVNWDADKKRLNSVKKRRFHSKIAPNG